MNIFDLITPDELAELPDDNNLAFTGLVQIASKRFNEITNSLNDRDEDDWRRLEDARYGFINVIISAAKRFEITVLASIDVPKLDKFTESNYRQFRFDLDHYLTQILIDHSIRVKRESIMVPIKTKEKIRDYVRALRDCIDKADLSDTKRERLHSKLNIFEGELEKNRLGVAAYAAIVLTILGVPPLVWDNYEIAIKLMNNISEQVAEAKLADDEQRQLPPIQKPVALIPPRAPEIGTQSEFGRTKSRDLDDEIPF
jgi:hypothetical protein